ncbi:hypothetical protein KR018_003300 [Drosophila ironensis]|nr:hypothetical protein KR018_003300 [Drosophila ironensis]
MTSVTGEKFTLAEDIKAPPTPKKKKRNDTNNHHVVPLGLLVLLCTAYITVAGLQHHFRHYLRSGVDAFDVLPAKALIPDDAQTETTGDQSERTEMVCRRRHIFGLEVEGNQSGNQHLKRSQPRQLSRRFKNGSGSRQLRMAKSSQSSQKKEAPRKSNTAEPIIYLFALVFIYLLLKAASDINQHYKSQNKGDKRLRRCSLQSYAQIHKQDRRASKGISPKTLPKF